ARALLVSAAGVVLDTSLGASLHITRDGRQALRFRSDRALVTLRPGPGGGYRVRVSVRDVDFASEAPLISASLQIGGTTFAASLGCGRPRGRRVLCRG